MVTLRIHHAVTSFEGWRKTFDADPLDRRGSGVRAYRIERPVDDARLVMIDLDFDTRAEAERFRARLEALWGGAGEALVEAPRAWIVSRVERTPALDHTIVHARDPEASAALVAELLGAPAPEPFSHFFCVRLGNDVTLDYLAAGDMEIQTQHYAFLVSEADFDQCFGRIRAHGMRFWADPGKRTEGELNHWNGGRGVYFEDPNGHLLELLTRPYVIRE